MIGQKPGVRLLSRTSLQSFANGRRDRASSHATRESFAVVQQVYRLLGVPRRTVLLEPEELDHDFDNQLAINWFRGWFD